MARFFAVDVHGVTYVGRPEMSGKPMGPEADPLILRDVLTKRTEDLFGRRGYIQEIKAAYTVEALEPEIRIDGKQRVTHMFDWSPFRPS